jgi:hypothetical protein
MSEMAKARLNLAGWCHACTDSGLYRRSDEDRDENDGNAEMRR